MLNKWLNAYAAGFQRWMPSPFAIAVLLTALSGLLACSVAVPRDVALAWVEGLWNPGLIRFGFQAMFMLVMGHVLALAPLVLSLLDRAVNWILRTPYLAAAKLALLSMGLGWLNWGLGLVGGAILVRGVLKRCSSRDGLHPGVLGAAGYTGLLVWHGGLSGSAPLKVAEEGHLAELAPNLVGLPDSIGLLDTVFSTWSVLVTVGVVVSVLLVFVWLGKRKDLAPVAVPDDGAEVVDVELADTGFLDRSRWPAGLLGVACLGGALLWALSEDGWSALGFITPDWINTALLGAALLAHGSINSMVKALKEAIQGASGILVQFPLYFGIMGLVTGTGLGTWMAGALVGATSPEGLPFALFLSSGVLNVFVPSGGGQWAVQGPLVLEACQTLNVPLHRGVMAMAFGDELTNMLQPFWALPLLGITGLKARDILPYTLLIMVVAGTVMTVGMFL